MVAITRAPGTTCLSDIENTVETLLLAMLPVFTNTRPAVASSVPLGELMVRTTRVDGCGTSDHGFEYSAVLESAVYE